MTAFDDALALVLMEEGGRVDNKKDFGGRTAYGVTQRTFDAWQNAHKLPRRDVWTITQVEVAAIYRNAYADPVRFDALPAGVGYAVFDDGVNSGTHESIVEMQRALGMTGKAVDGAIGTLTLAAVTAADPVALIGKLCDGRLTFLRRLKAFVTFGKGWTARVAFVRSHALKMAAVSTAAPKVVLTAATALPAPVDSKGNTPVPETSIPVSLPNCANSQVPPCARPDCPLRKAA